jgi:MFS family permease
MAVPQDLMLSESTATVHRGRVRIVVVALMLAFSVMTYFDRTIMSIAGPSIIKEFRLSETEMGSVYSAFTLSYALMMIPCGWLADRFGPWRVMTGMGFGAGLLTALTALGGKPGLGALLGVVPSFLIIRLVLGIFTAPIYPCCGRMIFNWFEVTKRARIWGIVAAGAGVGSATSSILFAWMIARYGWRFSFCLSGVATTALAGFWFWYARDHPHQHPALSQHSVTASNLQSDSAPTADAALDRIPLRVPWGSILADRNLLTLTVGYFTVGYFEYIFFFWIYYYFGEIRKVGPTETGIYTSLTFISWMIMSPLGGWASDRLVERLGRNPGRSIVPFVCLTVSAALLVIGINLTRPFAVALVLALSLGFASAGDGPFWATVIDMAGENGGAASAILNTGGNLGGFFAPVVTPLIASYFGWPCGLYAGSALLAAGAMLWFAVDPAKTIAERRISPRRCTQAGG